MKNFIAILAILVFYVSVASAADYTVKVPQYSCDAKRETSIILKTICINGYKFLVTYVPAHTAKSSAALTTTQMYKQQGLNAPSTPMKCSD